MRFGGFGPVALSLFPDPVTGTYKDPAWQTLGETLRMLLSPEEYESAKRTTFNAFYTSPTVIRAMHEALGRLGVPREATVLEPGCGSGNFIGHAPRGMRFIGVELDSLSGRIARTLHPGHDIRIENFRDTTLPEGCIDAVIGNVPFADVKLEHRGLRLSLHDFFFAKSIDARNPAVSWRWSPAISRSTNKTVRSVSTSPSAPISWAPFASPRTPLSAKARAS